jgi:formylglycine-generating enzyme required for sulfatase activity
MLKIFISYRRADSRKDAGRIYDRLMQAFGVENVFIDVNNDNIPLGKDFRGVLRESVAKCDVVLALIGKAWLNIADDQGNRRLDNPNDFVRIEIESALQRDSCLVIPVIIDNAYMPAAKDLPDTLRELAFKNATIVRDDPDFHPDVDKIIRALKKEYQTQTTPPTPVQVPDLPPTPEISSFDIHAAIDRYYLAFDERDWQQAKAVLDEIRASGVKIPRTFSLETQEKDIAAEIETQEREAHERSEQKKREARERRGRQEQAAREEYERQEREAKAERERLEREELERQEQAEREAKAERERLDRDSEYSVVQRMAQAKKPNPTRIWEALQGFWEHYPDYDPDNLARYKPEPPAPAIPSLGDLLNKQKAPSQEVTSSEPTLLPLTIDVLPYPFDWINIPSGDVGIEGGGYVKSGIFKRREMFSVATFDMAKYPITNEQYAVFMDWNGYNEKRWWTKAGWEEKSRYKWNAPKFWEEENEIDENCPVVGVSWHEAIAFCNWLSETTKERITLPTEHQWQRAAQGDTERLYPWGDIFGQKRCNSGPTGPQHITPVYEYEELGKSFYNVVDMAGNVCEWCITNYHTGSQDINPSGERVLRGGSWVHSHVNEFRNANRHHKFCEERTDFIGFRIARLI